MAPPTGDQNQAPVPAPCTHMVKIEHFSNGVKSNPDIWLQQFNEYSKLLHWTDTQKAGHFPFFLKDGAQTWWYNLDPKPTTFLAIETLFNNRFLPIGSMRHSLMTDLLSRVQKDGESVENFIEDIQRQARLVKYTDLQTIDIILKGLHADLKPHVLGKDPQNFRDLLEAARAAQSLRPYQAKSEKTDATTMFILEQLKQIQLKMDKQEESKVNVMTTERRARSPTPNRVTFRDRSPSNSRQNSYREQPTANFQNNGPHLNQNSYPQQQAFPQFPPWQQQYNGQHGYQPQQNIQYGRPQYGKQYGYPQQAYQQGFPPSQSTPNQPCKTCGLTNHIRSNCVHRHTAVCEYCQIRGHLAQACLKLHYAGQQPQQPLQQQQQQQQQH